MLSRGEAPLLPSHLPLTLTFMTQSSPLLPPMTAPPAVPLDRAVYLGLSTDHYPWTEVTVDLAARQAQGLSAVFDAVQENRWARFVWLGGQLLGGFTHGGQPVLWNHTMQAMPRARISLVQVQPAVAQVIWACRAAQARPRPGAWPDLRFVLEQEAYYGLLVSGEACSYWISGRVVGGTLPPQGAVCLSYSPNVEGNREALVQFWIELMATIHRNVPLDEHWRQVLLRLSDDFPCLDPFMKDIHLQHGTLHIDPNLPVAEFSPALQAALHAMLARMNLRLSDLKLGSLPDRPEWASNGLEGK